ncbi:hypothetical protein N8I74_09725 [Chitiniphilus purpureus]|uniref:Uncharacterized protein n=1 Tax=Chitiniphilus purpureus TaxID=2981137 RepID=A0ABY6DSA4_9NEIS|nr:hypothetical protein [Chitiniphilus sp. CD1]UXY17265.1 hypothetical protein N8I74_09725 [Chitiniphilus sp. CD1]
MKTTAALSLCLLLAGLGFWLEGGLPAWAAVPIVSGLAGCMAVALIVPGSFRQRAVWGAASLVLFAITFSSGARSFDGAFNACIEQGEDIRILLKNYREETGHYPERLGELKQSIPCGRIARPTLLEYERSKAGYVIVFGDGLVEYTATESDGFMEKK